MASDWNGNNNKFERQIVNKYGVLYGKWVIVILKENIN